MVRVARVAFAINGGAEAALLDALLLAAMANPTEDLQILEGKEKVLSPLMGHNMIDGGGAARPLARAAQNPARPASPAVPGDHLKSKALPARGFVQLSVLRGFL